MAPSHERARKVLKRKLVGWRENLLKTIVLTGRVIGVSEGNGSVYTPFRGENRQASAQTGNQKRSCELGVLGATCSLAGCCKAVEVNKPAARIHTSHKALSLPCHP